MHILPNFIHKVNIFSAKFSNTIYVLDYYFALNILYYPTNESIRFSNNLIFLTVLRFIVISATFCQVFAGFSPAFGLGLGAVLGISAVSATFSRIFPGFLAGFGCCFRSFRDYSSPSPSYYAINLWLLNIMLI